MDIICICMWLNTKRNKITKATLCLMYCNYYLVGFIFKIFFDYIVLMIVYVKRHTFNNI